MPQRETKRGGLMDIGCRWTRICCGTSDVRSSLSCPVGCYRKSQSRAGTYRLAREITSEAVYPLSALGAVRAFSLKMASKRREKELLLEYPLLGSFLCLQSGARARNYQWSVIADRHTFPLVIARRSVPLISSSHFR